MVTIKDVAKQAGVHPSTVSRVIKNHKSISTETKDRVNRAMRVLGYVPNYAAQTLATGQSFAIALVLPPIISEDRFSEPFFLHMISTLTLAAKKKGYTISIATSLNLMDLQEQVELMYSQKRVDGFILLFNEKNNPIKDFLDKKGVPTVVIGLSDQDKIGIFVDNDNYQMGYNAVDYLIGMGHKRILFVTDNNSSMVFQNRYNGYFKSCQNQLTEVFPAFLYRQNHSCDNLFLKTLHSKSITSLVVIGDRLSVRLIQLLSVNGYHIPQDISMITFNNSDYATLTKPHLTTFDINIAQLGQEAFDYLLKQIINPEKNTLKEYFVPFKLIERESVFKIN